MPASGRPLRVGVNLLYLLPGQVGGSEIYGRRLVDAYARLRPDAEVVAYCGTEAGAALAHEDWPSNVRLRVLPVRAVHRPLRVAAEMVALPLLLARDGVDVLLSVGTTSPPFTPVPAVATILDLIYEHFPATFSKPARAVRRALVGPGARRAARVITISEAVKRDAVANLRLPPDRVVVVYPGFGMRPPPDPTPEADLRARHRLGDDRLVLCVSAALGHKNLPRLIEAFAATGDRPGLRLVVAGHPGRERDALLALARRAGIDGRFTMTGWISDEDLESLYRAAAICVYPSLHEGFGLPVLEAMARDVPLACSNATALPEVAGDAAELFDPLDTAGMAAAVARLLNDPARAAQLVERGRERVGLFTWERCARETDAVLCDALAMRGEP